MFSMSLKPRDPIVSKIITRIASAAYCTPTPQYIYPKYEDDFTKTPQYPPIEPVNEEALKKKELYQWYDKIKRMRTIEEKLLQCNMPRYYGWKCLLLREGLIPYNSLQFIQYITRTHLIETSELPEYYNKSLEKSSQISKWITTYVQDILAESSILQGSRSDLEEVVDASVKEKEFTNVIVNQLNKLFLKVLNKDNEYLLSSQIDYSPRIESSWHLGSLTETYVKEKYRHGVKHEPEEYIGRPSDKYIQYIGNPILQLRIENPLSPVINHEDCTYFQYPVPIYRYDPFFVFDYEMVRRHVTNIPGFWPGEPREFGFLSYHDTNHIKHRPESYGSEEAKETFQCHAILASFAWAMSLATFQGFTTFHNNTYPFVTQAVLTDGKQFTFAAYQLNTTELHHEEALFNPKCNICWVTPTMELYESIENGKVKGLNENVIKLLLQFYMNEPEDKDKCVRKPYLDNSIQIVANYKDDEKRAWLEKQYKHLSSNRPRHRVDKMYEVADFERIYKIQFYKLTRDKKCRPFDLNENPYHRRLDDHSLEYIPKADRTEKHLPKWKQQKFKKTYYPE